MDCFGLHRAALLASLGDAISAAEQHSRNHAFGQNDLFGGLTDDSKSFMPKITNIKPWTDKERLQAEKETLGLYLSGHPISLYEKELSNFITCKIMHLNPRSNQTIVVAGLVVALRVMNTKRGNRMAFIRLNDKSASMEVAVFSDTYNANRELL